MLSQIINHPGGILAKVVSYDVKKAAVQKHSPQAGITTIKAKGGVPGGTAAKLFAFKQDNILPALFCQMISMHNSYFDAR